MSFTRANSFTHANKLSRSTLRSITNPSSSTKYIPIPRPAFTAQSIHFGNGASAYLNLGVLAALNGARRIVISMWMRYDLTGWALTRFLFANNQVGNRQIVIEATDGNANGDLRFGLGNGTTLSYGYVPAGTFDGEWFYHLVLWADLPNDLAGAFIDGVEVALVNQSAAFPTQLPTVDIASLLGAQIAAAPQNFWIGQISNFALWASSDAGAWLPSLSEAQAMWSAGRVVDLRNLQPSVPQPTIYVPGHASPVAELIIGNPVTGPATTSTRIPTQRLFDNEDDMFEERETVAAGDEPWRTVSAGALGLYSATPSVNSNRFGMFFGSYNQGNGHEIGHSGIIMRSQDGLRWPAGERPFPLDPQNDAALIWPHGVLYGQPGSNARNFTLTRHPGIGVAGADRWITPFNETQFPPQPDGRVRRIWVQYYDGDDPYQGAIDDEWSTPYDFIGNGTDWNSVGRARTIRLPDGSLIFGYYYRLVATVPYNSAIARSVDGGVTWSHYADIVRGQDHGNVEWEEPHLLFFEDTGELVAFVRRDDTHHTYRFSSFAGGASGSWSGIQAETDGYANPVYYYRARDNLLLTANRADLTGDPLLDPGVLKASRDRGYTWTQNYRIPFPGQARYAQGDFFTLPDDSIGLCTAQELVTDDSATIMFFGKLKESFLARMR